MRVHVVLVPTEREEPAGGLAFEMPDVPRPGDHVTIQRSDQEGTSDFIVRRRYWTLEHPKCAPVHPHTGESIVGVTRAVTIECEFAVGSLPSEEHKKIPA
ncbi:MAG: hypothetical protein ACE5JZ_06050 [Kiloniellales bacterium]